MVMLHWLIWMFDNGIGGVMKKILFVAFLALVSQPVLAATTTTKQTYSKNSSSNSGYKQSASSSGSQRDTSPGCTMDINPKAPSAPCPKGKQKTAK